MGGDRDNHIKKPSALAAALKNPPAITSVFFVHVTGYHLGNHPPIDDRTLPPMFACPSSTLVSSVSLRAYPGSRSLKLGVPNDSG
jgi:hypothetical protein